jgi:hypothetical protein
MPEMFGGGLIGRPGDWVLNIWVLERIKANSRPTTVMKRTFGIREELVSFQTQRHMELPHFGH